MSSLAYERVCVLYNIAAMQSQVGAAAAVRFSDSDEEMKNAAKLYQVMHLVYTFSLYCIIV